MCGADLRRIDGIDVSTALAVISETGMDKPKAVTAAAHKLVRLVYTRLSKGEEYTDQDQDQDQEHYEERYLEQVLRQLSQRAQKMGMKLVVAEKPA